MVSFLTSWLRRLTVPVGGAMLVVIIVIVALVVLDLGGLPGDSAASLPVIRIGSASMGEGDGGVVSPTSTTLTTAGSPAGDHAPDSAGKTTVVTEGVRVEPRHGYQGGPATSVTTGAQSPATTGAHDSTSTTGFQGSTSTSGLQGSSSTGRGQGSSSSGSTLGPSPTGSGR